MNKQLQALIDYNSDQESRRLEDAKSHRPLIEAATEAIDIKIGDLRVEAWGNGVVVVRQTGSNIELTPANGLALGEHLVRIFGEGKR